jgi:hypothetical protein
MDLYPGKIKPEKSLKWITSKYKVILKNETRIKN